MTSPRQSSSSLQSELIQRAAESFVNGQANPAVLCDVIAVLLTQKFVDLAATIEVLHGERAKKNAFVKYSFRQFVEWVRPLNTKEMCQESDRTARAIAHVVDHVNVLAWVLQFLKMDTRATECVAAKETKNFLHFVERMFTLDQWTAPDIKETVLELGHLFQLPYDNIARIVMPIVLYLQARNFLAHNKAKIIEHFPRLEDFTQPFDLRAVRRGEILFADEHFDSYDATLIRSTLLSSTPSAEEKAWEIVAATPPYSTSDVEKLLDNTAFNEKCKVTDLVVLANKFGEQGEMVNWFFAKPGTCMQFGKYTVKVERVGYAKTGAWMDLLPPLSASVAPDAARHVEFLLEVKNEKGGAESVTVNFFKTAEGRFIDLWRAPDFKKFYQLVVTSKTVAYCAADKESGGSAVFLNVLARRFNQVFVKNNLQATLKNVTALLKRLRAERPELMLAKERVMLLLRMSIQLTRYHIQIKNNLSTSAVLRTLGELKGSGSLTSSSLLKTTEEKPAEPPRCKVVEEDKEVSAEKLQLQIIDDYSQTAADKIKPSR